MINFLKFIFFFYFSKTIRVKMHTTTFPLKKLIKYFQKREKPFANLVNQILIKLANHGFKIDFI